MAKKDSPSVHLLRIRAKFLLAAASAALAKQATQAAKFKDPKAFKAQLVKSLSEHRAFDKAAHDLHALHQSAADIKAAKGNARAKVAFRPSGRIQASRSEAGPRGRKS